MKLKESPLLKAAREIGLAGDKGLVKDVPSSVYIPLLETGVHTLQERINIKDDKCHLLTASALKQRIGGKVKRRQKVALNKLTLLLNKDQDHTASEVISMQMTFPGTRERCVYTGQQKPTRPLCQGNRRQYWNGYTLRQQIATQQKMGPTNTVLFWT